MTRGDLFKYQGALPDLPVPPLQQTLKMYKQSIIPYYPEGEHDKQYLSYCAKIDKFAQEEGPALQEKLQAFAVGKRNWLSEFWDNYAYLDYRDPVSPYVSYFYSHKDVNSIVGKDQVHKAAAIIQFVCDYASMVEMETITPELKRNEPFCMESFKFMFNNSRKPGQARDYTAMYQPEEGRFVVVISNGFIYKLNILNDQNNRVNLNGLVKALEQIKLDSASKANDSPIGVLTGSHRDTWYENFTELVSISPLNEISLNEIDKSIFVLTLDSNAPLSLEGKSRNCWHGDSKNRWFDKPVQMFVSENGSSGFLGEHSKMDGTPTLSMNDWLVSQFETLSIADFYTSGESSSPPAEFKELKFEINPKIKSQIKSEEIKFNERVNALDIRVWQNFGLGKNDIKTFKSSPDSFVQMLIQLAYYKLTGTLRPTYESASTRKFFKGRTETCRSVSAEALAFVKTWEDPLKSKAEKIAAFRTAIESHGQYIKMASNGEGVDRHLFGLLQMSEDTPEIFKDPIFKYSQYWYLSTSQLSSNNFNGYGWAPVVPEGVGMAYMINNDWLHINLTCYKDNVFGITVDDLSQCLTQASLELKQVLSSEVLKAKL